MSTIQVTVGGQAVSYTPGSLRIDRRVNSRSTGSFRATVRGANVFEYRNPVHVSVGARTLFDGWLDAIEEEAWEVVGGVTEGRFLSIDMVDHHYLADKRTVTGEWEDMLAGDIVRGLLASILQFEGVTEATIEDGLLIERYVADHRPVSDVIDDLAGMSGLIAFIDFSRGLHFRRRDLVPSSVVAVGSGMIRGSVKVRRRNPSYRNKQHVVGADKSTEDLGRKAMTDGERAKWGASGQPDLWGAFEDPATSTKYGHRYEYTIGSKAWKSIESIEETDNPAGSENRQRMTFAADTEVPLPDADWYFERLGNVIWRNPLRADPTLPYFVIRGKQLGAGSTNVVGSGGVNDQTFSGNGSKRQWDTIRPFGDVEVPRVEVFRDSTSEWTVQTVAKEGSGETAQFFYVPFVNVFRQDDGETVLGLADKVRVRWIEEMVVDAVFTDADEIARQRAREGGTTTGIVEAVSSDFAAETLGELTRIGLGELNKWSHDTVEVEYQTWDSSVVEGEALTIDLPWYGISMETFLVDWVRMEDSGADGDLDTKGGPVLMTVSAVRSPVDAELGGAFGRSANPATFPDLFKQLNDPIRLRRPIEDILIMDVTPGIAEVKMIATATMLGIATVEASSIQTPEQLGARIWVEGDDLASGGVGSGDEWPSRVTHAGAPAGTTSKMFGSDTVVEDSVLNGHNVVDYPSWDSEGGHSWHESWFDDGAGGFTSDEWPNGPTTIILVARVDFDPSFAADAFLAFTNDVWIELNDDLPRWDAYDVDVTRISELAGPGLDQWALFTVIHTGGAGSSFRIDAVEIGTATWVNNTVTDRLQIGNFDTYGGQIAAMAAWDSALAGQDLIDAEAYFQDRFAL